MYQNRFKIKLAVIAFFSMGTAGAAMAQNNVSGDSLKKEKKKLELYRTEPVWIEMAKDTNVNFLEAKKAFDEYWKNREVAEEEFEKLDLKKATLLRKIFQPKVLMRQDESVQYSFEHKKFKNWMRQNEPYLQPDGTLLTPDQRVDLWEQYKKQQN